MIAGVVLAGGQSSRMGCDKSQLEIDGKSLVQHTKQLIRSSGIKDLFISGKNGIQDKHSEKGPLAGLFAGLEYLPRFNFVLFTPVDMPLLSPEVFNYLIENKNAQAVYIENHFFPLLICNSKPNRKTLTTLLNSENLTIKNMLEKLGANSLKNKFHNKVFSNANTQNDWKEVLDLFNKGK